MMRSDFKRYGGVRIAEALFALGLSDHQVAAALGLRYAQVRDFRSGYSLKAGDPMQVVDAFPLPAELRADAARFRALMDATRLGYPTGAPK